MSTQLTQSAPLAEPAAREHLDVVLVGHVDHGKSTVIGRLLADTGSLPQGKLEQVRAQCARSARPFEYAFLLDALKHEQAQGITIDTARCFFQTARRNYILHDAPGHIEFLKNMVTGAARAQAALLVIDAHEGIQENSRRHGYILSLLGIRQLAVLVNKMDLVGYSAEKFQAICAEYADFLRRLGVQPACFIPIAAREGLNLTHRSPEMDWYAGPTALEQLDAFSRAGNGAAQPLRLPVQDVYKFTAAGDDRRIIAGTVETGTLRTGDKVVFHPSGKEATVRSLEFFGAGAPAEGTPGQAVGFTFHPQIYVKPGELVARAEETPPLCGKRMRVTLFWLGRAPLVAGRQYKLKIGAARAQAELLEVRSLIDATALTSTGGRRQLNRHDIGECVLETTRPVAFDLAGGLERTSRFVIIDNHEIAGCGIILERVTVDVGDSLLARRVQEREMRWDRGLVSAGDRRERYRHPGKFVVVAGDPVWATGLAKQLDAHLFFHSAVHSFYLSLADEGGIGAHWERLSDEDPLTREEQIRRLGEQARIMTEAGLIFITAIDNAEVADLEALRLLNTPQELFVVARRDDAGLPSSCALTGNLPVALEVEQVVRALIAREIIPDYCI